MCIEHEEAWAMGGRGQLAGGGSWRERAGGGRGQVAGGGRWEYSSSSPWLILRRPLPLTSSAYTVTPTSIELPEQRFTRAAMVMRSPTREAAMKWHASTSTTRTWLTRRIVCDTPDG